MLRFQVKNKYKKNVFGENLLGNKLSTFHHENFFRIEFSEVKWHLILVKIEA
jgi:hypothetical protein